MPYEQKMDYDEPSGGSQTRNGRIGLNRGKDIVN